MTLKQFLFEGTDGADMTIANTGADQYAKNGGTAKFATGAANSGLTGARFTATAAICIGRFKPAANNAKMAVEGVFTLPATPPSSCVVYAQRETGDTNVLTLGMSSSNTLSVYTGKDSTLNYMTTDGSVSTTIGGAKNLVVTPGGKYRMSLVASGASTTTGSFTLEIYTATGTTPLAAMTRTGVNLSANMLEGADIGIVSTGNTGLVVDWDDLQFNDGATTKIGPILAVLPTPVLTVTKTDPTAPDATDGQAAATWTGAGTFESCILPGEVTTGAASTRSSTATNRTFTGLAAGTYTVAVRRTV